MTQSIEDEFLVNFFAFHLDFMPIEKQGLLEAVTLPERAERLRDMLDFKLSEAQWTGGRVGSGKNAITLKTALTKRIAPYSGREKSSADA